MSVSLSLSFFDTEKRYMTQGQNIGWFASRQPSNKCALNAIHMYTLLLNYFHTSPNKLTVESNDDHLISKHLEFVRNTLSQRMLLLLSYILLAARDSVSNFQKFFAHERVLRYPP